MGTFQLGQELKPNEVDLITEFLHSLTGKMPPITYPILLSETAGTPRPSVEILKK